MLMELFDTAVLPEFTRNQSSSKVVSATRNEDVDSWRDLQQKWEAVQNELESVDWKLLDMRSQLEALHLEYVGESLAPHGEQRPSQPSDFHGPNPFSDAIAAGRETVPVADQVKANLLLRRLSSPNESLESRVRQVKAEEHETFALALAREMSVMKNSYEQQLRRLTSQRLRAELAAERSRSQRSVAQLSERIAELETGLVDHEKALTAAQTQQQAVADRHAAATNDDGRQRALRSSWAASSGVVSVSG